ncbi:hypothetical protein PVK06_017378 [Gossypium arboreum]|uniref:Uncharacterized protein n=1 Tax=Gossypium arboreum TaxID=29729 RepID=A0ABR0Q2X5_GOSAR|nr:hypothetical protein PVK06_017378 [Gossypium arboreum]
MEPVSGNWFFGAIKNSLLCAIRATRPFSFTFSQGWVCWFPGTFDSTNKMILGFRPSPCLDLCSQGKGFLGDSSGSCALEVDMSETPCLSASIPLRSRQQARIYVVEDGSEEGIPQSESTDLAHGFFFLSYKRETARELISKDIDEQRIDGALGIALFFSPFLSVSSDPFVRNFFVRTEPLAESNPVPQDPISTIHPPCIYAGDVASAMGFGLCRSKMMNGIVALHSPPMRKDAAEKNGTLLCSAGCVGSRITSELFTLKFKHVGAKCYPALLLRSNRSPLMLLRRCFFAFSSLCWTGALVDTWREQAKCVVRNGKKYTTTSPLCWTAAANTVVSDQDQEPIRIWILTCWWFLTVGILPGSWLAPRLKQLYKRQCYQRCLAAWNVISSSSGLWNGRIGSTSTPGFFPRLQERKALPASSLVWHSKEQQLPRRLDSVPSYTFYPTYVLSFGIAFYHTGANAAGNALGGFALLLVE